MPKISIVTPIWCDTPEKVNWLDEMIQSVIGQSLTDWELILINDKSPQSLDSVKLKYADEGRLRWLENAQNEGPAKTRNTAVAIAESDCILPLDSDDMLADNEVLEIMYDTWLTDKTKTVYGNVQLYKLGESGSFERSKVFQLAHYSFEGAMNLEFGIMPVTVMHSKEAHYKAGGWKSELEHGREDLEYWIACGKAGYCGLKINYSTLLYRKHEQSRDYKLKFELKELSTVQHQIKAMHSDIYRGEFPMACCGKGGSGKATANVDPMVISQQNQASADKARYITTLAQRGFDFPDNELEWVAYQGPKMARMGDILTSGPSHLPPSYEILGKGHFFQIHKRHHKMFSDRQRLGFRVNQPDPRQQEEKPQPEPVIRPEPKVIPVAKPELSTLVRLDKPGIETEVVQSKGIPEVIIEPNPPQEYSGAMATQMPTDYFEPKMEQIYPLSDLKLSPRITKMLSHDNWTVESLADTTPEKLSLLPGIATKRANSIIAKAKELINNQ